MTDATIDELIQANPAEAARRIERQITLTTWGRIHELRVEVAAQRVVVFGRTPSHYVKQLVLQAVFDVLGPATTIPVELQVEAGAATGTCYRARMTSGGFRRSTECATWLQRHARRRSGTEF
jgi:hypothetical protein